METPDEEAQLTSDDNAKSAMLPSQKMIGVAEEKLFLGAEVPLNEKFRENPPPLASLPPDAPVRETVHPSTLPETRDIATPSSSRGPESAAPDSEKDVAEETAHRPPRPRREVILRLRRRTFFWTLYIGAALFVIGVIIIVYVTVYLTHQQPDICDFENWFLVDSVSTPQGDYNYQGCYTSMTDAGTIAPVVQKSYSWNVPSGNISVSSGNSSGPAYVFPPASLNNTGCALLCQEYKYFSTGQETNDTETCRCGNYLSMDANLACQTMCNSTCGYDPVYEIVDKCGSYGYASVYQA